MRRADGSAGDADYGLIGGGYARFRRPDERIAALIHGALGNAESLPFEDKYFDAGMALYTVHQWSKLAVGLAEMRRGLSDGSWEMRYGHYRSQPEYLGSLPLVISR